MTTPLEVALQHIAEGRSPVPVPHRSKRPIVDEWQKLRITADTASQYFNSRPQNVGVILGTASSNEVDIDLDCAEALAVAPGILPPTRTFGRKSKPRSHWIYRTTDDPKTVRQFRDQDNSIIVEYRATRGQTVYPGSTHESGEPIEWTDDAPIARVQQADLFAAVGRVGAAVLLVRAGVSVQDAIRIVTSEPTSIASHADSLGPRFIRASHWLGISTTSNTDTASTDTCDDPERAFERCRAYVARIDGAISGSGGHNQTFHVAQVASRGFGLSHSDTMAILREFNQRCQPPWTERELEHKAKQAADKGEMVRGSLLNAPRPDSKPTLPAHDPETGEVSEPSPAPFGREPLQRIAEVIPDVDPRFVCPAGFQLGTQGLVKVTPARAKTCPSCGKVAGLDALECPKCKAALPVEAPDVTETIARTGIWIGAELVRTPEEGNLLDVVSVVARRQRHVVAPRGMLHDPRKLAQLIEGAGIALKTGRNTPYNLATYLSEFLEFNKRVLPRKTARSQFGWDDKMQTFLLGKRCVGASDVVFYSGGNPALDRLADWLSCAGDVGIWQQTAQEFIEESPSAALVLAASVSSCMLRIFGWAPIGVALASVGGGGKTAQLHLGASVWGFHGDPSSRQAGGLVGNGNSTMLALLGQFMSMPDLPHFVDELKINTVDARSRAEFEAAMHQLIDGVERARMRRDGKGTQGNRSATGSACLATETATDEFLRKGGAVRRYMPLEGPYGGARRLGEHIPALCRHYGHPGLALVEALVAAPPEQRKELAARHEVNLRLVREGLSPEHAANETIRTWSDQIAVALAAADVACTLCPDVFPDHEVWTNQILAAWERLKVVAAAESRRVDIVEAAYLATVEWIVSHRAQLWPSMRTPQLPIRDGVGKIRVSRAEDTDDEELLTVDVLSAKLGEFLASKGHSLGTVAPSWVERGWLQVSKQGGPNLTMTARIGGARTSVYRINLPVES